MSELGKAGNRPETSLTSQQQSVRTCMYLHSQTPPPTPNTHTHQHIFIHTHTQRCTSDNSALPLLSSPACVKSNFLSICLAPLPPISFYFPSFPPHLFFLMSYLFCLFSILCPACWIWSAFHVYHAIRCRAWNISCNLRYSSKINVLPHFMFKWWPLISFSKQSLSFRCVYWYCWLIEFINCWHSKAKKSVALRRMLPTKMFI